VNAVSNVKFEGYNEAHMPNQDMLFPILPRPTPPVNLHEIVHHDVPRVEKQTEAHNIDTEQHHPQQQPHANNQDPNNEPSEVATEGDASDSAAAEKNVHPEHIDVFI